MSLLSRISLPLLAAVVVLCLQGCEDGREKSAAPSWMSDGRPPAASPEWSQYLMQHTSGTVRRDAEIHLRFARDVIDVQELDADFSTALQIQPETAGSARFRSPRELVFDPAEPLQAGARYTVRVDPKKISRLPESLEPYVFEFDVLGQSFEVRVDGAAASLDNRRLARITGELRTADRAASADVERVLSARYENAPQPITWTHADDGLTHLFAIDGLQRPTAPANLLLAWDGTPIGVKEQGQRDVAVPVRGIFSVTGHTVTTDGGKRVTLRFSEALDASQDLAGLVQIGTQAPRLSVAGNSLIIYPDERTSGEQQLVVNAGVRNEFGERLETEYRVTVNFRGEPPQVRFTGTGVVLPAGDHLEIPFEAINVHSVQVTAFQIFDDNIGQFLQDNALGGNSELGRVGRHLWRKTIPLTGARPHAWERFSLDATDLVKANPGALFRFTIAIDRGNSMLDCSAEDEAVPVPQSVPLADHEDRYRVERSSWDYAEEWYGQSQNTNWSDRDDPCKDAYYRYSKNVTAARNFIGSNIGLLAKHGNDGSFLVLATDLRNGTSLPGARIEVRNFQDQVLQTLTTDTDGLAVAKMRATPFYLVARNGGDIGYLKLNRGTALPTSHFDVGGQAVQEGVKGLIYGERDVWRPGDTLHLTFALHDPAHVFPDDHPVTLQLISPQGRVMQTATNRAPLDGFYAFAIATTEDAPTGNWTAKAILGGKIFTRTVKIETVMPNRLAMELDTGEAVLRKSTAPLPFTLDAKWLHGATAANLEADINVRYAAVPTTFSRFSDHIYDDPARRFTADPVELWKGTLDANGHADVAAKLDVPAQPPGMLRASFVTRVFEPGGAFSISRSSAPYHPYPAYVGIRLPKGDAARNMLLTDTEHTVSVATLNPDGEPLSVDGIEVTLYKIDWKWWWDRSADSLANYASAPHRNALKRDTISTRDGKGEWKFSIAYPEWGRYLVRACDRTGGHCTGSIFYIDWPGWAGRAREQAGPAASMLTLTPDRAAYSVGETAHIELPANISGRALLTVENGAGILEHRWLQLDDANADQGRRLIDIPITQGMAPNVYVAVTLVQPHAARDNDRPIRLFGVVPLLVNDPATRIAPEIDVADSWKPRSMVNIGVREAEGRAMTYTLAVVDEGLLGLTNFRVPDLHDGFYSREALGVLTWDLFDQVVGAYGADLERLLALGGGDAGEDAGARNEERRFPPVVRFMGPFRLDAGATATHAVDIPEYIGAVRVMIVAGRDGAYGAAAKSVTVREPVSALVTLPRVLGPGEEIDVPVSLFVYDETLREATVSLETGEHLDGVQPLEKTVTLDGSRESTTRFRLRVAEAVGRTSVTAIVRSGPHETRSTTHLEIRAASAPRLEIVERRLKAGETWNDVLKLHGLDGTNSATLSLTTVPPFGLDHRLDFLVRYPYGCVEQTTSAALPQVYLPKLVTLGEEQERQVQNNVHAGLKRLRSFQTASGGFSYWPGSSAYSDWSDVYAGYFLVEAKRFGYDVPQDMLSRWLEHATALASQWTTGGSDSALTQAFRLYVLAAANQADIGAMNRLREAASLPLAGRWLLAAAYATAGLSEPAAELLRGPVEIELRYDRPGETFGSALRDMGILLQAQLANGDHDAALAAATEIASELATDHWHSTQSVGFSLAAMGRYVIGDGSDAGIRAEYRIADASQSVDTSLPLASVELAPTSGAPLAVTNRSERPLFATLTVAGVPRPGEEEAVRGELAVDVEYHNANGENVDIAKLEQGSDIIARVTVQNRSGAALDRLALRHVVPSGWEIANSRMDGTEEAGANFTYRDIRDDRVYTHFALNANESRTFTLRFTAAYAGRFYAPGIVFEDMYDNRLSARTAGRWVEVLAR